MRIVYEMGRGLLWSPVDLAQWASAPVADGQKRVSVQFTPEEWARVTSGTREPLSDLVSRMAKRWHVAEGEAARHVQETIVELIKDRVLDEIQTHRDPATIWKRGYDQGYADGLQMRIGGSR